MLEAKVTMWLDSWARRGQEMMPTAPNKLSGQHLKVGGHLFAYLLFSHYDIMHLPWHLEMHRSVVLKMLTRKRNLWAWALTPQGSEYNDTMMQWVQWCNEYNDTMMQWVQWYNDTISIMIQWYNEYNDTAYGLCTFGFLHSGSSMPQPVSTLYSFL